MTVKEIKGKRAHLQRVFENLQKLELYFNNNPELSNEIADKSDTNLSVARVLSEARMEYYDLIAEIDKKIDDAVIQD